jgi:hypothetical protein
MTSSRPSTPAAGSTANFRWTSPLPRAKAVGHRSSGKNIPLGLLCPTFGPLLYAASLGTVAAMVISAFVSLIVSALQRLGIWSFVADHIGQRPIAGWGSTRHAGYPVTARK